MSNFEPNFQYHHKVQGFIYSLLRNTEFENLHDKKGYKFFCFSNIFKSNKSDNKIYNLIISSPSKDFIEQVSYQLHKIIDNQIPIEIGILFELVSYKKLENEKLVFPLQIITGSPIVLRIPLSLYEKYKVESAPYKSIYWRSNHPVQLFVEALEKNLKKKYFEFTNIQIDYRIFETFNFKKQVSTKLEIGNSLIPIIGSLWGFGFSKKVSKELQLFALDCGLGERNSLGFGFMNTIFPTKN